MKCIYGLGVVLLTILVSCSAGQQAPNEMTLEVLREGIRGKRFKVQLDVAQPLVTNTMAQLGNAGLLAPGNSPGRILLLGNEGVVVINNDSVWARLPYFGERQFGGDYNSNDIGIEMEGKMERYQMQENEKRRFFRIRFNASDGTEVYQTVLDIFSDREVQLTVNSAQRRTISYTGKLVEFEAKK